MQRRSAFREEEMHPLSMTKVNSMPQFDSKNQVASFGEKVKIEDHLARGKRKG